MNSESWWSLGGSWRGHKRSVENSLLHSWPEFAFALSELNCTLCIDWWWTCSDKSSQTGPHTRAASTKLLYYSLPQSLVHGFLCGKVPRFSSNLCTKPVVLHNFISDLRKQTGGFVNSRPAWSTGRFPELSRLHKETLCLKTKQKQNRNCLCISSWLRSSCHNRFTRENV